MTQLQRSFRLADRQRVGVVCDADGLFVGATPLIERGDGADGGSAWRPRAAADLNAELTKLYGAPADIAAKLAGIATVARALTRGDLVHAQIAALHLQLPDPPDLEKGATGHDERVARAERLRASGLLSKAWDEAKHPRWPAGSPDSVGGQFAPGASGAPASVAAPHEGSGSRSTASAPGSKPKSALRVDSREVDGRVLANFYVDPPSKVGGVIVQKVTITDNVYGRDEPPVVGWEAWEVPPRAYSTKNRLEDPTKPDDEWSPSAGPQTRRPSVEAIRTVAAEARFYEGISKRDLIEHYGFRSGGSGFSGDLPSTSRDPGLPESSASPPVRRSKTSVTW